MSVTDKIRQSNKILLINTLPRLDYWKVQTEPQLGMPLGLLSIGTLLKQAYYDVKIIDPLVNKDYIKAIADNLDGCIFVGLSVMTAGIGSALQISELIKKLDAKMPIVWGGVHPTLLPEQTLADERVDYICWGEGEGTALRLARALRDGHSEPSEGLGMRGQPLTPRTHFLDPNDLPMLDYSLLDMGKYIYRDLGTITNMSGKVKVCVLNTGLGCPYSCRFCYNTHPSQKYRPKSLERLLMELDRIVNLFDPDVIHIQDDLFFVDKQRVMGFVDEYDKRGYRFDWLALARANYFRNDYLDGKFLERIKRHCLWLGLGIESGNCEFRDKLNKGITDDEVWQAVDTLARNGINASYAFMVGVPSETKASMLDTVEMMIEIKQRHAQGAFIYQLFRPYPGTALFDKAVEMGYKIPKSLGEWASRQDILTGYTGITRSIWIKDKGFVQYLLNAMEWSQYTPIKTGDISLKAKIMQSLYIILLKWPFSLSLNIRLLFGLWCGFWENIYCAGLRRLYEVVRKA